eukprot:TRINITY_DN7996_c0_g2_i1.p1 TRINITY_DN7996_c0_g2~~TRINITY_DN7996_c0_g2_i1.p1  ORF type:complete len:582 (+),score=120.85 TRINITY_DN7996_c0_g2_i1:68-1813(+)
MLKNFTSDHPQLRSDPGPVGLLQALEPVGGAWTGATRSAVLPFSGLGGLLGDSSSRYSFGGFLHRDVEGERESPAEPADAARSGHVSDADAPPLLSDSRQEPRYVFSDGGCDLQHEFSAALTRQQDLHCARGQDDDDDSDSDSSSGDDPSIPFAVAAPAPVDKTPKGTSMLQHAVSGTSDCMATASSQLASKRSNAEEWHDVATAEQTLPAQLRSAGRLQRNQRLQLRQAQFAPPLLLSGEKSQWRHRDSVILTPQARSGVIDDPLIAHETMTTGAFPWADGGIKGNMEPALDEKTGVPIAAMPLGKRGSAPASLAGDWKASEKYEAPTACEVEEALREAGVLRCQATEGPPQLLGVATPTPAVRVMAPCTHNRWDRITKKRHSITLRCRACGEFWKTCLEFHSKCDGFYKGNCPLGDMCPCPHIFSKATQRHLQNADAAKAKEAGSAGPSAARGPREVPAAAPAVPPLATVPFRPYPPPPLEAGSPVTSTSVPIAPCAAPAPRVAQVVDMAAMQRLYYPQRVMMAGNPAVVLVPQMHPQPQVQPSLYVPQLQQVHTVPAMYPGASQQQRPLLPPAAAVLR